MRPWNTARRTPPLIRSCSSSISNPNPARPTPRPKAGPSQRPAVRSQRPESRARRLIADAKYSNPMNPSNPQDDIASAKSGESPVTIEELQYHFEGLRSLFFFAVLGLIAATLAVDVCFVRRQMVAVRSQVDDQRPKINKMVAEYQKRTEPLVRNFTASMPRFAASNHD